MSIAETVADVVVVSIRVYWRTHDEFGRIPVSRQEWWFEIADDFGGVSSMVLTDWVSSDVENIADAVVEIAQQCDLVIGVDQVRVDTCRRTALWTAGT